MNNRNLTKVMGTVFFSLTMGAVGAFANANEFSFENGNGYGVSGCGLGAVVISQRDKVAQIVSVSVNGMTSNQSFAITTGTSNCSGAGGAFNQREQEIFAAVNMSSLEQEMVTGKGENLTAFASLLGCPSDQMVSFGNMTRKEYKTLSNYADVPSTVVKMIKATIAKDKALSSACMI